jgi:hypothetical protein
MAYSSLPDFDPTVNRFLRYADLGHTADLLPIIPPGAAISLHAGPNITPDKLGKVPGLRLDDGWIGFKGWTHADVSRETLVNWHDKMSPEPYGIGLNSRHIHAFDIDTHDEAFATAVYNNLLPFLADYGLGIRIGRPPGFLVPFRPQTPRKKDRRVFTQAFTGQTSAVEVLGVGQQFVIEGLHPKTGKPYTWHSLDGRPTLRDLHAEHARIVTDEHLG